MSKKSVKSQKQGKSVWSLPQNNQLNNKQEYFSYELVMKEGLRPSIQIEKHDQELKYRVIITFVGKLQECDQWGIQKQNKNHQQHKCFPSHCGLLDTSNIWNGSPKEQCRCCQGSLCSLKNDLILLLYLTFASTLIIPVNKMYKTAFSGLFQNLNISVHWKKGHSYYKAIVNREQQIGGLICWQDIIDIETLSLVLVNLNDKSKINLVQQIKKIKKRNAYNYCLRLYETKLKNKIMEATNTGQNVEIEYSKIVKIIEAVYKVSSGQLILADNKHSCQAQDDDFSRKKLIQKIYGLITHQDIEMGQERDEEDEDEEYDKFVYENIQELFQLEYLNQTKSNSIDSGMQIYSNVIKQVRKHMQVDKKCMFLMDVLLKSIFQRNRQQKIVHISPINREQKQNSQSQIQMLLSFEKEVTEQLLLSKSSAITQRQQVLIQNTTTQFNLKQYIRYLQQVLNRRNIPYEQLGTFQSGKQQEKHMKCTDTMQNSSILLQKLPETNNQSNDVDVDRSSMKYLYLQNKIQQMKKQTCCQGTNKQTQNMGKFSSSKKASSREVKPLACWKEANFNTEVRKQESKPYSLNKLPKPVQINSGCSQRQIGKNRTKSQKQLWRI